MRRPCPPLSSPKLNVFPPQIRRGRWLETGDQLNFFLTYDPQVLNASEWQLFLKRCRSITGEYDKRVARLCLS